jgi:cytochrome c peroxidase
MQDKQEMDLPPDEAVARLRQDRHYAVLFHQATGEQPSVRGMARAIATFERTLLSGASPFDEFMFNGQKSALSASATRGLDVFVHKARCAVCHTIEAPQVHPLGGSSALFTDNRFHNLGVGTGNPEPDPGRAAITKLPGDWGMFKTPTLRNIALTAPYMHDGSLKTLEDVVRFYDKGGLHNPNQDPIIRPIGLSLQERTDLAAFLDSLTGRSTSFKFRRRFDWRSVYAALSSGMAGAILLATICFGTMRRKRIKVR